MNLALWAGLIAGIAILVVWAIRRARSHTAAFSGATGEPASEEILQARYARGEITREQYEQIKKDIG